MNIANKIRSFILPITLIAACFFTTLSFAETLNRVVAVVNDDVITSSELQKEMHTLSMQIRANGGKIPSDGSFRKKALQHLIDKKLQLQIAKQLNIRISDQEVNDVVSRIAQQNQMTTQQLTERLQAEGMNLSAYKETLREQLLLQKVQQQEVASKITISQEEVDSALRSTKWAKQLASGRSRAAVKKDIEHSLLQEKFEVAGKNWLSKIRGIAFIDIKKE